MTQSSKPLDRSTWHITLNFDAFDAIGEVIKTEKSKQKHIDRIAWKAEAAQRRAKGMHFK